MSMCEEFKGKKTYTVVVLATLTFAAYSNGFIDEMLYQQLMTAFGIAGVATLRDGMNGSNEEKTDVKTS